MDDILIASHISSFNYPTTTITVNTERQNSPSSAVQNKDLPVDHAIVSSVFSSPTTGTILLRVIHGGLVIELISLSALVPPVRFALPSIVLPTPSLFLVNDTELHLILVTDIGSLFKLVIPIDGRQLWRNRTILPREFVIRTIPSVDFQGSIAHVQGIHSVAVSLPGGLLLRLEADPLGYAGEYWTESIFNHGSFFSSLAAFLPLHTTIPKASDVISVTSHPGPTDITNIWTLSRDRTLRLWKARIGCVASITLPTIPHVNNSPSNAFATSKYNLLDVEQQNLIRVFSKVAGEQEDIYVLVFIPTPSFTSGGFFCLVDSSNNRFEEVGIINCPKHTSICHLQDFTINGQNICALWERQGQSVIERTEIDISVLKSRYVNTSQWKSSSYMREPELTPAFMEQQLLNPGSLTEKFLEAIMKPGVFSSLTLRTALDRYIDGCLAIPGPPPPQLLRTYSNLYENIAAVVGCTVTLNRNPQTGGFEHANYWTALKRDWEGFVARCREVERSARWPLALGHDQDGVFLVERERVGSIVVEDIPIGARKMLDLGEELHSQYSFFSVIWKLRSQLSPRMVSVLESSVVDLMHQEIAFSFSEILQDQCRRIKFRDNLDDGFFMWYGGRLKTIEDLDKTTRNALDIIGAFDLAIKREDLETEVLTIPDFSEWKRSQASFYAMSSIEARYDLCLSLIILLFFLSDDLPEWDPALLSEVFAVFRGLAIIRFVSNQSTEGKTDDLPSSEDVIAQMRNMNVSSSKTQGTPKSSLLHHLIGSQSGSDNIASLAHNFLDSTGVLRSISPAHVTKHEILFCDRVRTLGFLEVAQELLSWLPRTSATTFLQSQVFLKLGRIDDSSQLLEKLAGCFGVSHMNVEDVEALAAVLPNGQLFDSLYIFYIFAADLFCNTFIQYEVHFSQLAIQVAPPNAETAVLWNTVINGLTDLGEYEDAYASIMVTPIERLKKEFAPLLAIRMCEDNAVEKLMSFNLMGISGDVEAALAFKARNADPRLQPSYSRILYTWYTRKGDYRNASLTMYQRARKLKDIIVDLPSFLELAEDQLEALSIAINALYLSDEKSNWILLPVLPDPTRKLHKTSKHIPESKYIASQYDAEIVHLADMEYECTLLRAQVDLIRREPSILTSPDYLLPPALIVMRLAQSNQYNQAMTVAKSLKIDMMDLFIHLTNQCIQLTRNPGSVLQEDTSGWLLTDKTTSWQGASSDRGWRYLQQSLMRHDGPANDYRYAKTSLETILGVGQSSPSWLVTLLEKYQPEYLIRISLKYENITDAVNYTLALVLQSDKQLSHASCEASTSWLPYALIDQVLIAAETQMNPPGNLQQLSTLITKRIERAQKFSKNVSSS